MVSLCRGKRVSCWGIDLLGFYGGKPKNSAEVEFKDKGDLYRSWKSQEPSCPRPLTRKIIPQLGVFICTQSVPFLFSRLCKIG